MSDSTIANLTSGSPAQAADVLPIQRANSTLKLAISDVLALAPTLDVPIAGTPTTPSPLYTTALEIPDGITAAIYAQDVNGNWHTQGGIDTTTTSPTGIPQGTLTFSRSTFFRDTLHSTQISKNALVSLNHQAGAGTAYNNQDRALCIGISNFTAAIANFSITNNVVTVTLQTSGLVGQASGADRFQYNQRVVPSGLSIGTYLNGVVFTVQTASSLVSSVQTLTLTAVGFTHANVALTSDSGRLDQYLYAMEGIQIECDVYGSPVAEATIDGEYAAASFQITDLHTGLITAPAAGALGVRVSAFRASGSGSWGSNSTTSGISSQVINDSTVDASANFMNSFMASAIDNGPSVNLSYCGYKVIPPVNRFANQNIGLWVTNFGTHANDYSIKVDGGACYFGGNIANVNGTTPNQNFVLAGPTSGSGSCTFRALVAADYPTFIGDAGSGGVAGAVPAPGAGDAASGKYLSAGGNWSTPPGSGGAAWSSLSNPASNLTLSNAAFTTEFDQTTNALWKWFNTTTATISTTNTSPLIGLSANYWTGAASAEDKWTIGTSLVAGTNGLSQLTFSHTGSTGVAGLNFPALLLASGGSIPIYAGTTKIGLVAVSTGTGMYFGAAATNTPVNIGAFNAAAITANNVFGVILINSNVGGTTTTAAYTGIAAGGLQGHVKEISTFSPVSGSTSFVAHLINPTINQTSTASGSYTGLLVNVVETALLGSSNKLLDLQAGNTGGTSMLSVGNSGVIQTYAGTATVGQGIPSEITTVDVTAQSSAIAATNIVASAPRSGMYRVSWSATITTVGTTSVLGGSSGFQVGYTSPTDSVAKLTVSGNSITSSANTTGTAVGGSEVIYAKVGTAITYQYDYTSTGTAMVYELHLRLEAL